MLLSVICVTLRDPEGLGRTLESLENLYSDSDFEIEVLVQNGGSNADIEQAVGKYPWASFLTEKDSGVYDAMGKAMKRSRGQYIWFLNGGDESNLLDFEVFQKLPSQPCLLYFDYLFKIGTATKLKRSRPKWYINHALPTSHQAILYPGDASRVEQFATKYFVAGDYAFTAKLISKGVHVKRIRETISIFHSGGMSSRYARMIRLEAKQVQKEVLKTNSLLIVASSFLHLITGIRADLRFRRAKKTDVP